MAWELLKTDYVDAVFDGLRRYLEQQNGDGSVSFLDVTNYTVKEGSFFGAKDVNKINTAVNAILGALENGTDLYEVFTQFFEQQKELFCAESDAKQEDFETYVAELQSYMSQKWDELKTDYTEDIEQYKAVQENAFNVWFEMVRNQLTSDVAGHLQSQIGELYELQTKDKTSLTAAVNEVIDNTSRIKTYVKDGQLHFMDSQGNDTEINFSSGLPLAKPTDVSLTNADESVIIKWTDPEDIEASGAKLATWSGTLVVRKAGSQPTSKTDGVVVVDSKTRNQYASTGFTDNGLTNDTEYYYGVFPYTTEGKYNYDYYTSITPTAIYPSAPTGVSAKAGNAEIEITFTKPSDATGIRIVYGTTSPESETDGTIIDTTASPYTISNLTNDTTYYIRVYSYNEKGRFTASTAVSATPKELLVPWTTGTDEQIKAMVDAYYNGDVTLDQIKSVWAVGDSRNITLSAMSATGVGESHSSQTVQLTIIGFNHDYLSTSVNGKSKALVTVQLKNCLNTKGYMNSTTTNSGGWQGSARRTWCNNVFYASIPSTLKGCIRQVSKKNYKVYNSSTITTTSDYCFLLSETEIYGLELYSAGATEGAQYDYYKTKSNRIKQVNGSNNGWWQRSPGPSSDSFCYVLSSDGDFYNTTNCKYGLAPAFCL